MPQFLDILASPIDGDAIPEPLTGLDDIGESREGSTLLSDNEEPPMRWDLLVFRRGEVAVILYIVYPDEDEAIMPFQDIARLLDDRIEELESQD